MLVCKPKGRGNWTAITLQVQGKRATPLLVRPGQEFTLAGISWRICSVDGQGRGSRVLPIRTRDAGNSAPVHALADAPGESQRSGDLCP